MKTDCVLFFFPKHTITFYILVKTNSVGFLYSVLLRKTEYIGIFIDWKGNKTGTIRTEKNLSKAKNNI